MTQLPPQSLRLVFNNQLRRLNHQLLWLNILSENRLWLQLGLNLLWQYDLPRLNYQRLQIRHDVVTGWVRREHASNTVGSSVFSKLVHGLHLRAAALLVFRRLVLTRVLDRKQTLLQLRRVAFLFVIVAGIYKLRWRFMAGVMLVTVTWEALGWKETLL